jgi:Raf kinase inhibitor-like YbhB/YbcL family protein
MANGFSISSPAFPPGGAIPRRHTCEGDDVSPRLRWTNPPAGTQAFALIVDDRTARGFVHWVLADIPADATELPEGSAAGESGAPPEGRNDFGRRGWGGPCPPPGSGDHEYVFTLLALSAPLGLSGGPSAAEVRAAASGRTLASAVVEGTFGR